jgi:hypothetical protein
VVCDAAGGAEPGIGLCTVDVWGAATVVTCGDAGDIVRDFVHCAACAGGRVRLW